MSRREFRLATWAALLTLLACAGCDAFTSSKARLDRARTAFEEGRIEAAVADARTVAEKEAGNPDAWLLLARIGVKYGDSPVALAHLEKARTAGANPDQVRPIRDQALLAGGKYQEVLDQAATTPDQQAARATALLALDRRDEAMQLATAVLSAEPRHTAMRLLEIRGLLQIGQTQPARSRLDALLADEPELAEALAIQGRLEVAGGDLPAAIAAFEKAVARAPRQLSLPEQARLLVMLAEAQLGAANPTGASATVASLARLAPGAPITNLLLARIALAQGDANTAVTSLQRSLAKDPEHQAARLLLGAALIQQGSIEQARSELSRLIADRPENMEARRLLARLYVSQGDLRGAERILTDLPEGVRGDPLADWMRSAVMMMSGERAEGLALLEQTARAAPGNVQLQLDLARAYLAADRREEASAVLGKVPPQLAGRQGKQLLVLSHLSKGSAEQARQSLSTLGAEYAADGEMRLIIGQYFLQLGDVESAGTEFRAALAQSPELVEASLGLATLAISRNELASARAQLQKIIEGHPRVEQAYLGLAAVAAREKNPRDARQWLEKAVGQLPESIAARLALAELDYREKHPAAGEARLGQAIAVARDKPAVQMRAGDIQLQAGQPEKAISQYEQAYAQRPSSDLAFRLHVASRALKRSAPDGALRRWLQNHPGDTRIRAALADYLLDTGALRDAVAEYERLVQSYPAPALLNNLAWAYQKTGDARAEATAQRAYDGAPGNANIADTYGWILLEKGKVARALPLLEKAAGAMPDNAEVQGHLARARELSGRQK